MQIYRFVPQTKRGNQSKKPIHRFIPSLALNSHNHILSSPGFSTAKGELVRAILFPKPLGFKFYQDAIRFVMFLGVVACFGMAYSIYTYIRLKVSYCYTHQQIRLDGRSVNETQCLKLLPPPPRQPSDRVLASSAGGPGFNSQSRTASYQRRYNNGASSALVQLSTLKRENTGSFSRK